VNLASVGRRLGAPGVWVLAALAYLPALTAAPGRMPTDTKLYLYLDPGRLIADAPFSWDTRQFAGWVPHQTIAYLWPSGPWFWVFEQIGIPDWIAHRLWIGTILLLGGLGVRWAAKLLGLTGAAATVAGLVFATSPYILPYISRTSVMLLPWAGVGWLVGLTIRAATRRSWRDVALFGLVVLTIGAVNAAALALVAPAPVLWLLHAAWQRTITWRQAWVTALQLGAISLLVSLWWIVMLLVQGKYGADVLAFSETLDAVSLTSVSTETLRGLGYWLFYVRDPYGFATTASLDYMARISVILAGYGLLGLCLLGLAITRWSQRRFAAMLVFAGIVLAVGVHPIDSPSPLMQPLADSALGLALRSSTRALPLSTFGLALGAGALVAAVGTVRLRWRPWAAAVVAAFAIANLPALWTGGFVDPALERDQDVPGAWTEASATLDAGDLEARVLQVPGSEFGAFRWGYTVDPPLPGLTEKPLVTRDLLPLGSPGAMDLLYALDNRFQDGTIDPAAIAPVARFLSADTIWVPNDLAFDRFRTPRPEEVAALFADTPSGLEAPASYGEPAVNSPRLAMIDERTFANPNLGTTLAPVQLVRVADSQRIVRAGTSVVEVAGSGDGMVDAAAAGLLRGDEIVVYSADRAVATEPEIVTSRTPLVITDSNRDRAYHWRGSQDVVGFTETGGDRTVELTRSTTADQRLAVFASNDPRQQTTAHLAGELGVRASEYGEPFAYRPEDRAAMAVDGDTATAWRVSDRADPTGQSITIDRVDDGLVLLQPQDPGASRRISRIAIDDGQQRRSVDLTEASLVAPGQPIDVPASAGPVTITIEAVIAIDGASDPGATAVGFAELGPVAHETTMLPAEPMDAITPDRPLAIVVTRLRVRATDRWRDDPERSMSRTFTLPVARTFDTTITLRINDRASDDVLATTAGRRDVPIASARLAGVRTAVGSAAFDGDLATSWTSPFGAAIGSTLTVPIERPSEASTRNTTITITQPVDAVHSTITRLDVTADGATRSVDVPTPDAAGRSTIDLGVLDADDVRLTVSGIEARTTVDRRYGETITLPVAISEITGLAVKAALVDPLPSCRTDLLRIDGEPVGVRVDDVASLLGGAAVDASLCDGPLVLDAGTHVIETANGRIDGIDVDRITMRSGFDGAAITTTTEQPSVSIMRTRTTRTATVSGCADGCWLVLGEGYDPAWRAELDGGSLGAPTQVNGGFNGWWLPASDGARTITMTWPPQRSLSIALLIAGLAVLACVALAIVGRRRRGVDVTFEAPTFGLDRGPTSRRSALIAGGVLVVVSGIVIAPVWAALALIPAAAVVLRRRPADLLLASVAAASYLGFVVAWRVHQFRFFADARWPGFFEDLHQAGVFVVVLLLAGALFDDPSNATSATAASTTTVGSIDERIRCAP